MLRRALRHAFTLLSALSLLLCVAVCVLWVRSNHRPWLVSWDDGPTTRQGIRLFGGALSIADVTFRPLPATPDDRGGWTEFVLRWREGAGRNGTLASACGFDFYNEQFRSSNVMFQAGIRSFKVAFIPLWPAALLTGSLPIVWLYTATRRRRRVRAGHCRTCGYDLRAHAGGGPAMSLSNPRCPECGAAVPPWATEITEPGTAC